MTEADVGQEEPPLEEPSGLTQLTLDLGGRRVKDRPLPTELDKLETSGWSRADRSRRGSAHAITGALERFVV
jgi:hypothetical protein